MFAGQSESTVHSDQLPLPSFNVSIINVHSSGVVIQWHVDKNVQVEMIVQPVIPSVKSTEYRLLSRPAASQTFDVEVL